MTDLTTQTRLLEDLYRRLNKRKYCAICGGFGYSKHTSPDKRHRRSPCAEIICEIDALDVQFSDKIEGPARTG